MPNAQCLMPNAQCSITYSPFPTMFWKLFPKESATLTPIREARRVRQKQKLLQTLLVPMLATLALGAVTTKIKVLAQYEPNQPEQIRFVEPNVQPPITGPNIQRTSRRFRCCPCGCPEKPVTALVPATTLGLTAAAYPAFFVYVPPTFAEKAEFVLFDEEDNLLYETTVNIAGRSGIIKVNLPADTIAPLEVSKNYVWEFDLVCNPDDRSGDLSVVGWIERVELDSTLNSRVEQTPLEAHAALFAGAGLWYDTLAVLAELRAKGPEDPIFDLQWAELLQSVGLETYSPEPLERYNPNPPEPIGWGGC